MTIFSHFGFGPWAAEAAAARGDIVVIVDVLSFTTAVTIAIDRGAFIYPCRDDDIIDKLAEEVGAEVAVRRDDVPSRGRYSLSPHTYTQIEPKTKVAVWSPNGATCSRCAGNAPYVLAGALINAHAVGEAVSGMCDASDARATVIACGERESTPVGGTRLRWAEEDILGAGAVLSYIDGEKSPAAQLTATIFQKARSRIDDILRQSPSGKYLIDRGYGRDVTLSAEINSLSTVPVLTAGRFCPYRPAF